MKVSLVISVYTNIPYLKALIQGLKCQTYKDFEVIVAEDNDSPAMVAFIEEIKPSCSFPLIHISQPDEGFRKSRIMNEAIRIANGELILFVDGDCVLHSQYIKQYVKNAREGVCLGGRRVLLDKKTTANFLKDGNFRHFSLVKMALNGSRHAEDGVCNPLINRKINYLLGSNMGMLKTDWLKINGIDEDYKLPCVGEDNDVEWRVRSAGIIIKSMRFKAVQYHLHHEKPYGSNDHAVNYAMMETKQKKGKFFCENGIQKMGVEKG